MRRTTSWLAIIGLALAGLDLLVAGVCRATNIPDRVTEIQQPSTLLAKLDRLKTAPGPKIVLVGDSLVHGGSLEEAGDPDWREHGLGVQLAAELASRPGYHPYVMNLGINGILPADLEYLVPLVVACDVEWILFDVHLRPFSTDFSLPDRQMARPWLRTLSINDGHIWDHSAILRNRTLIQENLISTRAAHRPALRPSTTLSATDVEVQSLVKLAQLKGRLGTLDLGPDGQQAAAVTRLLSWLAARGQRHVVFYAKENPALLPDVMDSDDFAARYDSVVQLVKGIQGPTGVFVPPVPELQPEHFIDFTHLTAEGYRLLARRLAVEIK
jgi:lysophospholipase L1-like esterase